MPSKTYFLNSENIEKLRIYWKSSFKTCSIKLNDQIILDIKERDKLLQGIKEDMSQEIISDREDRI